MPSTSPLRIIVDLPSGSGNGPQVSDNLRHWGVKSAPAYRLLINLAYQWHNPGVTVIPMGKGKARHWVQVHDPGQRYSRNHRRTTSSVPHLPVVHDAVNRRVLLQRAKELSSAMLLASGRAHVSSTGSQSLQTIVRCYAAAAPNAKIYERNGPIHDHDPSSFGVTLRQPGTPLQIQVAMNLAQTIRPDRR